MLAIARKPTGFMFCACREMLVGGQSEGLVRITLVGVGGWICHVQSCEYVATVQPGNCSTHR